MESESQIKQAIQQTVDIENGRDDADDDSDDDSVSQGDDLEDDPAETQSITGTASGPSRNPYCCNLAECTLCGNLPLRKTQSMSQGNLFDDVAAWDWDGGLYDIIRQMNGEQMDALTVPPNVADDTVEACVRHLKRLKLDLIREGLLRKEDQNYSGECLSCARVVAPLHISEIEVGAVLGTGGFSTVFEVVAFSPRHRYIEGRGMEYARNEEMSRRFLAEHALTHPADSIADMESKLTSMKVNEEPSKKSPSRSSGSGFPYSRYAVKHLRNGLVTRSPEKFKRAAIDLVLEGQLLLIMDHPNIVSIRGRSSKGPEAFRSGNPRDYFLVMDKLQRTLEEQMFMWRTRMTKFSKRLRRRTGRQRSGRQISSWICRKLRRNKDEGQQENQPQAPDKYAIKLQDMWLDRLKTAYQIASAIAYMHSKRLIHRDLKTSNIGFDGLNEVKLFDLGLSRLLPSNKDDLTSSQASNADPLNDGYIMSRVGTKFYMAPEVRRKERYNLSADVYSFGVVLWELLALSSPRDVFQKRHDELKKMIAKQRKGDKTAEDAYAQFKDVVKNESAISWLPICPCWPVELQDLIKASLSLDAENRPSMDDVKKILRWYVGGIANGGPTVVSEAARRRSTLRVDMSQHSVKDKADEQKDENTKSATEG